MVEKRYLTEDEIVKKLSEIREFQKLVDEKLGDTTEKLKYYAVSMISEHASEIFINGMLEYADSKGGQWFDANNPALRSSKFQNVSGGMGRFLEYGMFGASVGGGNMPWADIQFMGNFLEKGLQSYKQDFYAGLEIKSKSGGAFLHVGEITVKGMTSSKSSYATSAALYKIAKKMNHLLFIKSKTKSTGKAMTHFIFTAATIYSQLKEEFFENVLKKNMLINAKVENSVDEKGLPTKITKIDVAIDFNRISRETTNIMTKLSDMYKYEKSLWNESYMSIKNFFGFMKTQVDPGTSMSLEKK